MTLNLPNGVEPSEIILPNGNSASEVRDSDGNVVWPSFGLTVTSTLNGGSATMFVYEDTSGNGSADNIQEITLQDGENRYTVDNFTGGSDNDYWFELDTDPASIEDRVTVSNIILEV